MMESTPEGNSITSEPDQPSGENGVSTSIPILEAVLLYFFCFALMISVGLLLQAADLRIGLIATEAGLILLPTLFFIRIKGRSFGRVLYLNRVSPLVLVLVLLITIPFRICSFLISALVQTILPMPEFILNSFKSMYAELMFPSSALELALTILGIVVVAAVCEEVMFRGFILTALRTRKGVWGAIVYAALGFAIYHIDPWAIPEITVIGIFLGWLVVRTGSIYPAVLAHASFNFLGIVLLPRIFGVQTVDDFFNISFPAYVYPIAFVVLVMLFLSLLQLTRKEGAGNGLPAARPSLSDDAHL
jgi:membrane protease YdiL (CAAX protease family)